MDNLKIYLHSLIVTLQLKNIFNCQMELMGEGFFIVQHNSLLYKEFN